MNKTVALAIAACALAGCAGPARSGAPAATTAPTVATTTSSEPVTTVSQPTAPQPSPEQASSQLVGAWQRGDRAAAQAVASPAAVASLFAKPYPAAGVSNRACEHAVAGPSDCDYRLDSGLLRLGAVSVPGGWIIDTATFPS